MYSGVVVPCWSSLSIHAELTRTGRGPPEYPSIRETTSSLQDQHSSQSRTSLPTSHKVRGLCSASWSSFIGCVTGATPKPILDSKILLLWSYCTVIS
jgi:hypothetical protein